MERDMFDAAEKLNVLMCEELQSLMKQEVNEHFYDIAMDVVQGERRPFEDKTITFARKLKELVGIMMFLDEYQSEDGGEEIGRRREGFTHVENLILHPSNPDNWKIHAIKALREFTNLGLKDAKKAVEFFYTDKKWPNEKPFNLVR